MNIRGLVHALLHCGSRRALLDALDCDAYTAAGDTSALEGLGWAPCTLTPEEREAIFVRIRDLDAERRRSQGDAMLPPQTREEAGEAARDRDDDT